MYACMQAKGNRGIFGKTILQWPVSEMQACMACGPASCLHPIAGPIAGLGVLPPLHTVPSLPSWAGISGTQATVPSSQQASATANSSQWRSAAALGNYLPHAATIYQSRGSGSQLIPRGWGCAGTGQALEKNMGFVEMNQLILPEAWVQDAFADRVLVTLLPWRTLQQAYQEGSNIHFFVDSVLQHIGERARS